MGILLSKQPDTHFQQQQFELQVQRDELIKLEKVYQSDIDRTTKKAKEWYRNGEKENALRLIKLRKIRESNLKKIQSQRDNLEAVLIELDASKRNLEIAELMEKGNKEIQKILSQIPRERVEEIINTKKENSAKLKELDSLFEQFNDIGDENQIEKELNELSQEISAEKEGDVETMKSELIAESLPKVNVQSDVSTSKRNIITETI
ncbi:charged multivesicular body protein, putative [Entamoeba dispar SAW760]|uniref:Charged multivesicular body protein, putative n=1 Tax=Entamoeba dispar (strain ATCC PRA-260 / SAW760) TaxID=370354 RepID=B0ERM6_ENTDS|nr:charged multivesicular body protein, putative [Entamoeba dispar SAW760]EDR22830.1 charged multivesicular body protein, putative [Entamoeba dispar SAW760]|eukprot:EDR22830.1 charged multivesicular body protein, putative [Entamoeba dispar SAW760]